MKTAEEIYLENGCNKKSEIIEAMKQYAKQVAKQALEDAFSRSKIREEFDAGEEITPTILHDDYSTNWSELSVDKKSITGVLIKLP